jgi:hypothetical protein
MSATKTVEIPETVHRKFKIETAKREIPMKEATEEAIELWIKSKPIRARKELQAA